MDLEGVQLLRGVYVELSGAEEPWYEGEGSQDQVEASRPEGGSGRPPKHQGDNKLNEEPQTMTGVPNQLPNSLWVRVGMVQVTVVMEKLSGIRTRMAKIGGETQILRPFQAFYDLLS